MELPRVAADESSPEPQIDPAGSLLVPLLRSRKIVIWGVVLGAVAATLYGIVQANSYPSTGKLLVRYSAREESSPETAIAGPGQQGFGQPRDLVSDEIELLRVPQVFEHVVRDLTTGRLASAYDPTAEDKPGSSIPVRAFHHFQSWWFHHASSAKSDKAGHVLDDCPVCVSLVAQDLMKELKLTGEPGSSVITVSYAAHDPALARDVVTSFLNAAEERHRQAYSTNTTLGFVSDLLKDSLDKLTLAKNEFSAYRASCEVYDYDNQRTQLLTLSQDLDKQAAVDASKLAELKSKSVILAQQLAKEPPTVDQITPGPMVQNPQWRLLSDRLLTLKDQLDEIEHRVGGTMADREAAKEMITRRIERTTADLKAEPEFTPQDPIHQAAPNAQYQRLQQESADNQQEIAAQETMTNKVVEQLERTRKKLATIEGCGPRYQFLEATAKTAQESYDAYKKAHEKATALNVLDQLDFSNLRRIQDATLPLEKDGPKRGKFLIVGLLLGGLLGAGLAFLRHTFDPYLRSPAEVEHVLGLRVVGVLPRARKPRRSRGPIRHAAL